MSMQGYILFIFIALIVVGAGELTRKKGFSNLFINRYSDKEFMFPNEEFKITVVLENKKWFPLSFLNIEEELPAEIKRYTDEIIEYRGNYTYHTSSYSVRGQERVTRTYKATIAKRGVYFLRKVNLSVGDIFGFSYETKTFDDFKELVVYPEIKQLKSIKFDNNSIQGEHVIKRWIYKDPIYIKGIREYNVEDRMKDIHWKSSLRMNKLMVKEYDYTSEREVVLIINVQSGDPHWSSIDSEAVENGINIAIAMAQQCTDEGIPVGLWTNAQIISYNSNKEKAVSFGQSNMRAILELCARIDYTSRVNFSELLTSKMKSFNKNTLYVVITPFLNNECITILSNAVNKGYVLKMIDTSKDSRLVSIRGIEKFNYKGEVEYESI